MHFHMHLIVVILTGKNSKGEDRDMEIMPQKKEIMRGRNELNSCLMKQKHIFAKLCKRVNLQNKNLVSGSLKLNLSF